MYQHYKVFDIDNINFDRCTGVNIHSSFAKTITVEIKNQEDMEDKKQVVSDLETTDKRMRPFDLEAAKAGKPVCTRDGRKARIVCFDKKDVCPIVALVQTKMDDSAKEIIHSYTNEGRYNYSKDKPNDSDLMMLPEKHEGWVNVYKGIDGEITIGQYPYDNREACEAVARPEDGYIDTIKIEWYE